jgi:tetratricopeptide (TPR) repeat protein
VETPHEDDAHEDDAHEDDAHEDGAQAHDKRGKKSRGKKKNKHPEKHTPREPVVTELKGRQKADLTAPEPQAADSAEKTRKVVADASPSPAKAPDLEIGSIEVNKAPAPSPELGMDVWFAANAEDLDDGPPASNSGRYNTLVIVAIAIITLLGVAAIYFWTARTTQKADQNAQQEKIDAQERQQANLRKELITRLDADLQGRDYEAAIYTLRRLKTDANASNTPEYQQAEARFLKAAEAAMQEADAAGDLERARAVAQHLIQLKPDHGAATALLKRPIPEPTPEPDPDAAGIDPDAAGIDPDAAQGEDAEATQGEDAAEPAPAEADAADSAQADPTPEPPPVVAEPTPEPTPDPQNDKDQERAQRREEANNLLKEAARTNGPAALALYRKAAQLDPTNHRAHFQIGVLLSNQGDFAQALPSLERAVRTSARNAQYRLRLANAYHKTGNAAKAKEQYQKVLEIDPGNKAAQTMIQRL